MISRLPGYKFARTLLGDVVYQERAGNLRPPWHSYGLHMAVRTAKYYNVCAISVIEFGVANGRGLTHISRLAKRFSKKYGVKIFLYGVDTGVGLPEPKDFRDLPDYFNPGSFPMTEDVTDIEKRTDATIFIGDIRDVKFLPVSYPIGYVAFDMDTYSATLAGLNLLANMKLMPQTSLYFDDVCARLVYSKFTGELKAIDDFNFANRCVDIDRNVEWWCGKFEPWMRGMYVMHDFETTYFSESKTKIISA